MALQIDSGNSYTFASAAAEAAETLFDSLRSAGSVVEEMLSLASAPQNFVPEGAVLGRIVGGEFEIASRPAPTHQGPADFSMLTMPAVNMLAGASADRPAPEASNSAPVRLAA